MNGTELLPRRIVRNDAIDMIRVNLHAHLGVFFNGDKPATTINSQWSSCNLVDSHLPMCCSTLIDFFQITSLIVAYRYQY